MEYILIRVVRHRRIGCIHYALPDTPWSLTGAGPSGYFFKTGLYSCGLVRRALVRS